MEINRRDEDADMMKYDETELKQKKEHMEAEEQKAKIKSAENHLYELPAVQMDREVEKHK